MLRYMKFGVRLGLRALFFATLFVASIVVTPIAAALDDGQSSSSSSSSSSSGSSSSAGGSQSTPPTDTTQLYRVRYGAAWRGEITNRFYIERNIALAAAQGIVGDDDPDGDGWAVLGHTDENYDGKEYAGLSYIRVHGQKIPAITLNWGGDAYCALLTPISIDVVKPGEDRLLKVWPQRICFAPATDVSVVILPPPLEMPTQATDQPIQAIPVPAPELEPQELPQQIFTEPIQPQQTTDAHILEAIANIPVPGLVDAASTDTPNYIDGTGENSAQVAGKVGDSFLIFVSIILSVLVSAAFLFRFVSTIGIWK